MVPLSYVRRPILTRYWGDTLSAGRGSNHHLAPASSPFGECGWWLLLAPLVDAKQKLRGQRLVRRVRVS